MADGGRPAQRPDHILAIEIAGNMAHGAPRVKVAAIETDDARRFLSAMLQRVQAKRGDSRRRFAPGDAEHAALLAQFVVVERMGCQHGRADFAWHGRAGRMARL